MNAELRLPPHSNDAEQALLGALLLDNAVDSVTGELVCEQDFYSDTHRLIYRHTKALIASDKAADPVTVAEAIAGTGKLDYVGGLAYIAALSENVPSTVNATHYARIVHDHAGRRSLIVAAHAIVESAMSPAAAPVQLLAEAKARLESLEATDEGEWPAAIDVAELAGRTPPRPAFIVPDWLPAGYAVLLAGHGGVGKSAIALHLAVCIALGRSFFGLPTERRRVTYLSCEDRRDVLHWRLARICAFEGIDLAALAGWLDLRDLVGRDAMFWTRDPRTGSTMTAAFHRFAAQVKTHYPQVLFVDGVSDTFGGNENARSEVKSYVNRLLALVPLDGALVLIGHVAKVTAQIGASGEGYSGSTQWHNAVRARWYLYPETEADEDSKRERRTGRLALELQKSNLGRADQSVTFAWDEESHLFAGETVIAAQFDRDHRDVQEQRAILAAIAGVERAGLVLPTAAMGPRTTLNVLAIRPEFPASLKGTAKGLKRRFWQHVEVLRAKRHIDEVEYHRTDRHIASKFVLTTEGRGQCGQ